MNKLTPEEVGEIEAHLTTSIKRTGKLLPGVMADLARKYGVSRERIRQIKEGILATAGAPRPSVSKPVLTQEQLEEVVTLDQLESLLIDWREKASRTAILEQRAEELEKALAQIQAEYDRMKKEYERKLENERRFKLARFHGDVGQKE